MKFAIAMILTFVANVSAPATAQLISPDYQAQLSFAKEIVGRSSLGMETRTTAISNVIKVVRSSDKYARLTDVDQLILAYLHDSTFRARVDGQIPAASVDHDAVTQGMTDLLSCDMMDMMMGIGMDVDKCRNFSNR